MNKTIGAMCAIALLCIFGMTVSLEKEITKMQREIITCKQKEYEMSKKVAQCERLIAQNIYMMANGGFDGISKEAR